MKHKILKLESNENKLKHFACWIKNDFEGVGYANGYIVAHNDYKIHEVHNPDIDVYFGQEITFSESVASIQTFDKFKFIIEAIEKYGGNIDDYYIVGFDTAHSYNKNYNRHNVESALTDFYSRFVAWDYKEVMTKLLIKYAVSALENLTNHLKNLTDEN